MTHGPAKLSFVDGMLVCVCADQRISTRLAGTLIKDLPAAIQSIVRDEKLRASLDGLFPASGRRHHWRETEPTPGHIQGLPSTQGVLMATNGILCIIMRGQEAFIGHIDFFVADAKHTENKRKQRLRELLERYD